MLQECSTDTESQLSNVIDVLSKSQVSEHALVISGKTYVPMAEDLEAVAIDAGSAWEPIRRVLSRLLYMSVYSRRFYGSFQSQEYYQQKASKDSNAGLVVGESLLTSPDWHVETIRPDALIDIRRVGVRARVRQGSLMVQKGLNTKLREGTPVALVWPENVLDENQVLWLSTKAPNYYLDGNDCFRIYLNVRSTERKNCVEGIIEALNQFQIPAVAKTFLGDADADRRDGMLVYVPRKNAVSTGSALADLMNRNVDVLQNDLPLGCTTIQPGIGVASQAADGESLGVRLTRYWARVFIDAWKSGKQPTLASLLQGLPDPLPEAEGFRSAVQRERLTVRVPNSEPDLVSGARGIGTWLQSSALQDEKGPFWLQSQYNNSSITTEKCNASYYSGHAGIGIFLANVAIATGDGLLADLSRATLDRAIAESDNLPFRATPSVYSGKMGCYFAAWQGYEMLGLDFSSLLTEWLSWMKSISGTAISKGFDCDLYEGLASGVIALCMLSDAHPQNSEIQAILVKWSDHLVAKGVPSSDNREMSWPTHVQGQGPHLLGMAHGAAGVGWALYEAYRILGSDRFRQAALAAFEFERTRFDGTDWPDYRNGSRGLHPGVWCHGHPGGLLARSLASVCAPDDDKTALLSDIEAALPALYARLQNDLTAPVRDASLCHGHFGRFAIAHEFFPDCREAIRDAMKRSVARTTGAYWSGGIVPGTRAPSLMVGAAGTGWSLLHLAGSSKINPLSLGRLTLQSRNDS